MRNGLTRGTVLVLLLLLLPVASFADGRAGGAGGLIVGNQVTEYPFLEQYRVESNTLGLSYVGGFGYSVSERGMISGGFGMGMFDPYEESGIGAGVGGAIGGWRILRRPVYLAVTSWTGIGGVGIERPALGAEEGYFIFFQELSLELGLPFFSWFTPTFFAGYQVMGSVLPAPILQFVSYTPVIGFRLGWGDL